MTGTRCLVILLLVAIGAFVPGSTALSQTPKVPGLVQEGNYAQRNLGMQMQPAPRNDDAGTVYAVGPWPAYTPPLADGDGREAVQSFCGICHSTTYITMQPPLPSATWERLVNKMIGTFGAPIPASEARAIIAYLASHYTPETRKDDRPAGRATK
jgi:cytochrome c5